MPPPAKPKGAVQTSKDQPFDPHVKEVLDDYVRRYRKKLAEEALEFASVEPDKKVLPKHIHQAVGKLSALPLQTKEEKAREANYDHGMQIFIVVLGLGACLYVTEISTTQRTSYLAFYFLLTLLGYIGFAYCHYNKYKT